MVQFYIMIISDNYSLSYAEGVAVFHQPPVRRIISAKTYSWNTAPGVANFFLSFPSILFRVHYYKQLSCPYRFRRLHVVFCNEKKDKHYMPSLFNVGKNLEVCLGNNRSGLFPNLEVLCKHVVSDFWASSFNNEISHSNIYYKDSVLGDLKKWQAKTKSNTTWVPSRSLKVSEFFNHDHFYGESFKNADNIP